MIRPTMIYRVRLDGDQENPKLQEYLWEDLPDRVKKRKRGLISSMHRNQCTEEMTCFYSGVQTYMSSHTFRYAPWEATREHLVAVVHDGAGKGGSNIVYAGALLNRKMGHSPLPVKLLLRAHLATCSYDRSKPTYSTFCTVLDHAIALENTMKVGGKYPWQPHTYDLSDSCYGQVLSFYQEMQQEERNFLALPDDERRDWIRAFRWRW